MKQSNGKSIDIYSCCKILRLFWVTFSLLLCLGVTAVRAQDVLPEKAKRDHNSGPVYSSTAMENLMKFIPVSSPMP